ncbi:MAG: hypothetical protein A2600_13235 [Candidatus Lambdaproteobacteria bacterium RIFOXYD1_FULL_56_27]|uniref:Lcl C-terminal domain-containing protein n=1 Tax=Candidatus Lambdaproteobacteria bacterium RIFOXYD2_FULL_56_26 TaxID=1817773 RepID=A0A1F6GLL3_9PROT|nr:MAG: hypothetical protein A2557_01270 [Candidatus Lambdaproteobacteria bacterium RIFOXYD2_FULL_56_26]OGH03423.1 MAG: hypothetical protein A2426_03040 [Candidatus Lambdaproteobacteria bacterium RIFOXYC1_FULL_56_13]OGH08904.1 MAG: hypothetical protein A2600_13235 [Candidatus Lambdaproteobacteria bacterium RIFOXYD1_FULL_56_27]
MKLQSMTLKNVVGAVGVLLLFLLLAGCKSKDSGAESASWEKRSLPSGTSGSMIEQLATDLKTAGYAETLIANVVDYASAQVKADGTESTTDYGLMLASIQTGSASALGLSSSGLSTDDEKTAAIGTVSGSLAATLSSSTASASQSGQSQRSVSGEASAPNYAYSVTVDASTDYSSYMETLMTAAIGTMDEAGVSNVAIQANSGTVVTSVMTKLSGTTVSSEFLAAAMGGITAGAIAGVDDGGVGSSDAATVSETLLSSVMGKVSAFGFTSTHLENAMEKLASKAVSALGKSGVSSDSASAAAQTLMQTMVTKLTTAGVASTDLSTVMQKVSEQGVANLANAGVPSADRTTAVESLVSAISAKVKAAGVSDSDLSTVMAAIAQGAVSGTGSLGFSDADKQTAIANASSGALAGLKTAGYSTTQISNVSGSVTTGATKGLTRAGVSTADQSTFAARIQTGAEAGLSKGGLSAAEISALSSTLQTAINSGLSTIGTSTLPGTSTSTNTSSSTTSSTSSSKAITAFSFTSALNSGAGIGSDVTGVIGTTEIKLALPAGATVTALKATFTQTGATVTVGGLTQTSGTTANNFTSPVTYRVTAADGTTKDYSITIITRNPVPDTGQTTCWDGAGTTIPCPAASNALAQDGSYNTANQPSYTDNGNGTVTDNVTGLVWQKGSSGTSYAWTNALTYCSGNAASLAGTGWRLPNKTELSWIVKNKGSAPLISPTFTGTVSNHYWSSAASALNSANAWYVQFSVGVVNSVSKTNSGGYFRCVRGVAVPTQVPFIDYGNQTVHDVSTGLVWDQRETATMTWTDALSYCEALNHAGQTDWRLPNRNELESLVDNTKTTAPTINTTYFPSAGSGYYWSSTTDALSSALAWDVDFGHGNVSSNYQASILFVRCVR